MFALGQKCDKAVLGECTAPEDPVGPLDHPGAVKGPAAPQTDCAILIAHTGKPSCPEQELVRSLSGVLLYNLWRSFADMPSQEVHSLPGLPNDAVSVV